MDQRNGVGAIHIDFARAGADNVGAVVRVQFRSEGVVLVICGEDAEDDAVEFREAREEGAGDLV